MQAPLLPSTATSSLSLSFGSCIRSAPRIQRCLVRMADQKADLQRVDASVRLAEGPAFCTYRGCHAYDHIYAISDLHTDYALNYDWVQQAAPEKAESSVLLVAGDVSDRISVFEKTMEVLAEAFGAVFFVPGNHDLWVRHDGSEGKDSLQKMRKLDNICEALGVLTTPQRVRMASGSTISICPLLSFHHFSFDTEPDVPYLRLPSARATVTDFRATQWPNGLSLGDEALAVHLDACNEQLPERAAQQAQQAAACGRLGLEPIVSWREAREGSSRVLSFSHFLPRIELMPEKRYLVYPDLMKAAGSKPLGRRVSDLHPNVHLFGHSHFGWDATLDDGIRYVQAPLATPNERSRRPRSLKVGVHHHDEPMKLYDGEQDDFVGPMDAMW
eukprot:CAMPEP_0174740036 /NCGR_PEP_ID=MMETSP1094-20130205/72611_1 /TAXON_ID=156173 /ORGANISM="Chrysochromulina brevifilum, Strain UTEX LB 985" /LENGTH=385 /DNA_ID=CAMNT_0015943671 /DNA_START=63 /DNA_END=1217 /DNA_ORIENTATION=+